MPFTAERTDRCAEQTVIHSEICITTICRQPFTDVQLFHFFNYCNVLLLTLILAMFMG